MVQKDSVMAKDCIFIIGPTASGKTKLSIDLAKELGGEIINADSMYIYKDMNIGTAKPTKQEMSNVPHHLIDIINPIDDFSVATYSKLARELISTIKLPIIVGGTGFYIDSILYNQSYGQCFDEKRRNEIKEYYATNGIDALYNRLKAIDPNTIVNKNDIKRVIRAIEISESTNIASSKLCDKSINSDINPIIICLNMDRAILYDRINRRVDQMISNGLIDEVKNMHSKYSNNLDKIVAIGYKELFDYIDGKTTIDESIELIKKRTRNYAKRQITWFKRYKNAMWFDLNKDSLDTILSTIKSKLTNK